MGTTAIPTEKACSRQTGMKTTGNKVTTSGMSKYFNAFRNKYAEIAARLTSLQANSKPDKLVCMGRR